MTEIVIVFLQHGGEILLCRRSEAADPFPGRWDAVSGAVPADGDPGAAAERALREKMGVDDADRVRAGDPLRLEAADGGDRTVYPFRYAVSVRDVTPAGKIDAWEWVSPAEILNRRCVPELWERYRECGPTVADVAGDDRRGAAEISETALAVVRDAAAEAAHADALADPEWATPEAVRTVARRLRDARPEMAVVANRVNRVMATSDGMAELAEQAHEGLLAARQADEVAAREAAAILDDLSDAAPTVVTVSRSGTALEAIRETAAEVVIGECRTAREGVGVAAELAAGGQAVTLTTDAALPSVVGGDVGPTPDAAIVGADAVLPDGDVVNKVGTRALGLACERDGLPLYVVAARDKIATEVREPDEEDDPEPLYDGDAPVAVENPVFDRTPADCVTAVVTESGPLDDDGLQRAVRTHSQHAAWDE